jgi:2-polyprenyl-6-methoxyphenol hydroxylase-like FAD-dependent oxidoreductase
MQQNRDVLIVGAGPAGLALAIALVDAGFTATVLDAQPRDALAAPAEDGRDIALTHSSVATLRALGLWQHLLAKKSGASGKRASWMGDRQDSALLSNPRGHGTDALGGIVPNHALRRVSFVAARSDRGCSFSIARRCCVSARCPYMWTWTSRPRQARRSTCAPACSSRPTADSPGRAGSSPYPLVAVYRRHFAALRSALVGDSAVGIHPVTAHGYNLGLPSITSLTHALRTARATNQDIGAATVLAGYECTHRRDSALIYHGTNAVAKLYASTAHHGASYGSSSFAAPNICHH